LTDDVIITFVSQALLINMIKAELCSNPELDYVVFEFGMKFLVALLLTQIFSFSNALDKLKISSFSFLSQA